jgi:RNA polymerase sigma-B factor
MKPVDRHDLTRGSFLAFAEPTILGEIRRYFRDRTWPTRVPRSLQDRARRVASTQEELRARSGSDPTVEMIAEHLGLQPGEVAEARRALNAYQPGSLDATSAARDGRQLALKDTVGDLDPEYERVETFAGCVQALRARRAAARPRAARGTPRSQPASAYRGRVRQRAEYRDRGSFVLAAARLATCRPCGLKT